MKLLKIHLQNVKSYVDAEIPLYEGINFISGLNGSGKTTLIESIGYAVFNRPPYVFDQFIRRNARSGSIRVWFAATDERVYVAERRFTARGERDWAIYETNGDGEPELPLDLHGKADVEEWLRAALNIPPDTQLADLFEKVIGVVQGTFTLPFLFTPVPRRDYFDSILKVESYRQAYEKLQPAEGMLKEALSFLGEDIARLEGETRDYESEAAKLAEAQAELQRLTEKLAELAGQIDQAEAEHQVLTEQQAQLQALEAELKMLATQITADQETLKNLDTQLATARAAATIVEANTEGYTRYEELAAQIKTGEQTQREKNELERQRTGLDTALAALHAKIETQTVQLAQRRGELVEESEALQTRLAVLAPRLTEVAEERDRLAVERAAWQAVGAALRPVEQLREAVQTARGQVRDRLSDLERQAQRRTEIEEALSDYGSVKAEADLLAQAELDLQTARHTVASLEGERKTLQKDRKQAQGGLCPFLKEPCQNVEGGNLEDHFAAGITEVEAQLASVGGQVKGTKQAVEAAREAHDRQLQLDVEQQRLGELEAEGTRLVEAAFHALEGAEVDTVPQCLDTAKAALGEEGREVAAAAEMAKQSAGTVWPDEECTAESLLATAEGLMELGSAMEGFLQLAQAVHTRQDQQLTEAEVSLRERQTRLDTERQQSEKAQKQNVKNQGRLDQAEAELAAEQEGRARKEQERAAKQAEIEALGDVETQLEAAKQEQEEVAEAHEGVMAHRQQAGQVPTLEAQRADTAQHLAEYVRTQVEKTREQEQLAATFDPFALQQTEAQLQTLRDTRATKAAQRQEREKEVAELSERVSELEGKRQALAEKQVEKARETEALRLLQFVRETLRTAGEPIAEVYLQYLQAEATRLYRLLSGENVEIVWGRDYELKLRDAEQDRTFRQLSGGEQMSAAIAVRLALLKQFSGVNVGFFDEPTANLDEDRRFNLAQAIGNLKEDMGTWFSQIFLVSHDDAFQAVTENVVALAKESATGSGLQSASPLT